MLGEFQCDCVPSIALPKSFKGFLLLGVLLAVEAPQYSQSRADM